MVRVNISKPVLVWAVERSGLTADEIEEKFPKFPAWLDGTLQPTFKQLEEFAKTTRTPFGFLFLETPPDERLSIPHFRTVSDDSGLRPSPDLIDTVHTMERRQAWMREYLLDQGVERLGFIGSANPNDNPRKVAKSIRRVLGFTANWASSRTTWVEALKQLRETMEEIGILVVQNGIVGNNTHRKLNPEEFRGFVLVDDYAPLVFINGADGKAAQMFTIAHELAHIWFGKSAAFDLRKMTPANDPIELACNRVAAEFLVPETGLQRFWQTIHNDLEPIQSTARHFKVSELVIMRRLLDLGLISKTQFHELYRTYLEKEYKSKPDATGGDFIANQPFRVGRRFMETIVRALQEGSLLYSQAFRLTDLYGKAFEEFSDKLGLGRSY